MHQRYKVNKPKDVLRELRDRKQPFIFISDCFFAVSNDPLNITMRPEYNCNVTKVPTMYNCTPIPQGKGIEIIVRFDYEMHYNSQTDVSQTTKELEAGMVERLAETLGLDQCNSKRRYLGNRRRLFEFDEYDRDAIVAVRSTPFDDVDTEHECEIPVKLDSNVADATACQTMTGFMTLVLDRDYLYSVDGSIQNNLLHYIKNGMESDLFVSDKVRKVSFVGTRTYSGPDIPNVASVREEETDPKGLSIGAIAAIACSGFLLLLLLLFLVVRKRRRYNQDEPDKRNFASDQTLDYEVSDQGSFNEDDAVLHKRKGNHKSGDDAYLVEGAYVDGSLAANDSMALKPENIGPEENVAKQQTRYPTKSKTHYSGPYTATDPFESFDRTMDMSVISNETGGPDTYNM